MSLFKVVLHPDKIVKYGLNVKQAVVLDLILKQCDREKAENIMGLTFFKISNDKLLEDIAFLNIKKRMLIMIINELEKLDFIKKPRNQNRRMLLRFTNKAVEYFKS